VKIMTVLQDYDAVTEEQRYSIMIEEVLHRLFPTSDDSTFKNLSRGEVRILLHDVCRLARQIRIETFANGMERILKEMKEL
jgi:hypothetical protein